MGLMDVSKVLMSVDKIKLYKNLEDVNYDLISKKFDDIFLLYNSNNSKKINTVKVDIYNKFRNISSLHDDKIKILNDNILKYKNTSERVQNIFKNIV